MAIVKGDVLNADEINAHNGALKTKNASGQGSGGTLGDDSYRVSQGPFWSQSSRDLDTEKFNVILTFNGLIQNDKNYDFRIMNAAQDVTYINIPQGLGSITSAPGFDGVREMDENTDGPLTFSMYVPPGEYYYILYWSDEPGPTRGASFTIKWYQAQNDILEGQLVRVWNALRSELKVIESTQITAASVGIPGYAGA
jgi:hypothetical protein